MIMKNIGLFKLCGIYNNYMVKKEDYIFIRIYNKKRG